MSRINVALLAGGWSGEREVSLNGKEAIYRALDKGKYKVMSYDPRDELGALIEKKGQIDIAFIVLHGKYGEDGCIQGLLDILGMPYVGSGVLSSAMAMNKKITKDIYKGIGLKVPGDMVIKRCDKVSVDEIVGRIGSVQIVKPVCQGSSIGVSVCRTNDELIAGIEKALKYDPEVIVEEFIDGREITCCVLGDKILETLPLIEIVPSNPNRFFDYEAKYTPGATHEICPAHILPAFAESAKYCAKMAHRALKCSVWSRTDMIIRDKEIYMLETNTIPGMTENSLFPLAARAAGLSLSDLVDRLIMLALEGRF